MRSCQNRWATAANQERYLHILYTVIKNCAERKINFFHVYFFFYRISHPSVKREKNNEVDNINVSGTVTSLMTTVSQLKISSN